MTSNGSQILGVVLLVRNGDRLGSYQSPTTYTTTATQITPLGNQQEFQLGGLLRSIYLNSSSPSYISGISTGLFNQSQVSIRADLGGENGVIYESCVSLTQGLWPATINNSITLANGSTIVAPNQAYQSVPIVGVDPNLDVSLEGHLQCNTFNFHASHFNYSMPYRQMVNQSAALLGLLTPYVGGRPVNLDNIWDVYDYMNTNSIHNATFAQSLPPTLLAQARTLADWHQYFVFTDRWLYGIGHIAGMTLIPSILNSVNNIVNPTNPLKLTITAISYEPLLSLFDLAGVTINNPQLAGTVDYASALALEVRQPTAGGEPVIRFNLKNGTANFATYNFLYRTGDVPLSAFINELSPFAINTTADWCDACDNSQDRGCGALALAVQEALAEQPSSSISPIGAGFLGAGLALVVVAMVLTLCACLGRLHFARKPRTEPAFVIEEVELPKRRDKRDSLATLVQ